MMLLNRTILMAILAVALAPRAADAQIYVWRDASGTIVLSDQKIDRPIAVYAVPGAPAIRTTKPMAASASRFDTIIEEHASKQGLRLELVRAVIQVESAYNPRATSPKGAMGLMQLMPGTARELGVRDAYDPEDNIRGGTKYLRQLLDKYRGNEDLALAAYNAGSGAVDKYGQKVPPYRETKEYVRKVIGSAGSGGSRTAAPAPPRRTIYKTIEIRDGLAIPRYSDTKPAAGTYEVVSR
jgi:soluble lytic murein transglycosylase-like protein